MHFSLSAQERAGRIEGRVLRENGEAVGGVSVVLNETSATAITGNDGRFAFGSVATGPLFTDDHAWREPHHDCRRGRRCAGPRRRSSARSIGMWALPKRSSSALRRGASSESSMRPARSPAIPAVEIEQRASHAQLPKLLEFSPGVQVTQSGIYDYNLNTRGFNSSLNRRVATLIDGRDPSIPFLGAQEWAAIPFPLDDLAGLELLRGPSAALYGANASSGVLNMTTKDPAQQPRGRRSRDRSVSWIPSTSTSGGRIDLGDGWYTKVVGGVRSHDDFTVARVGGRVHASVRARAQPGDCLPQEAVPLARDRNQIFAGAARLDKHLANGMLFIIEGGIADLAGPVFQTGIGRDPVRRCPATLGARRFHVRPVQPAGLLHRTETRNASSRSRSGANLADSSRRIQFEGQTNFKAGQRSRPRRRRRVRCGGAHRHGRRAHGPPDRALRGGQTPTRKAVFGQVDWNITDQLKLVARRARGSQLAARPRSSRRRARSSTASTPTTASASPTTKPFRFRTTRSCFCRPTPHRRRNLGALNALCAPFRRELRLRRTRVLALGNADLELEKTQAWEIGYKGILAGRAFLTIDFYRSAASNFVTDLIPQLGTPLGRVNPSFGPWQAPAAVPASVAATIRASGTAHPVEQPGWVADSRRGVLHQLRQRRYAGRSISALNYYFPRDGGHRWPIRGSTSRSKTSCPDSIRCCFRTRPHTVSVSASCTITAGSTRRPTRGGSMTSDGVSGPSRGRSSRT